MVGFADNDMVEQDKLDQFARRQQATGCIIITSGWFRIPRGMIVNQDDGSSGNMESLLQDAPNINSRLRRGALRNFFLSQALVLSVQKNG